jgi:hypothetical protein
LTEHLGRYRSKIEAVRRFFDTIRELEKDEHARNDIYFGLYFCLLMYEDLIKQDLHECPIEDVNRAIENTRDSAYDLLHSEAISHVVYQIKKSED